MKISNEFTVGVPVEQAWAVLTDLEGIAPCLPGAQLTGRDGDSYQGKVKIKVGPVTSEYAGTAAFAEKDDAAHRAVIDAKGRDSRGAGNASARISAELHADGDRTRVTVETDLRITGKIAQFGSGMITEVSQKLLGQFVTNLEATLAADQANDDAGSGDAGGGDAGAGSDPEVAESASPVAPTTPAGPAEPPSAAGAEASSPPARSAAVFAATPEPEAIDLLGVSRGAVLKRVAPLVAGALVLLLIIRRVARRRR